MPRFYSELQEASLENKASDATAGTSGRIYFNTTGLQVKTDDGTNIRALLRNDQKCIIGNNGTANNNIRLNRAASGVLQIVPGGDTTAEGSLSTSVAQLSSRLENYTDSGKPAAGNAGRAVWLTDLSTAVIDDGATWQALGGGGSGGALRFIEASNSPIRTFENEIDVYSFSPGLSQQLYLSVRVPQSYVAGRQIRLRILWTCASTANNALIASTSTLIRSEVDVISSTTNQRNSTNSAVTMSAGNANEPQKVILDLTSSTGQINSVSVTAGDLIKVRIYESGSTCANDIKLIPDASEVTFT
jgi:hypothetical protein